MVNNEEPKFTEKEIEPCMYLHQGFFIGISPTFILEEFGSSNNNKTIIYGAYLFDIAINICENTAQLLALSPRVGKADRFSYDNNWAILYASTR